MRNLFRLRYAAVAFIILCAAFWIRSTTHLDLLDLDCVRQGTWNYVGIIVQSDHEHVRLCCWKQQVWEDPDPSPTFASDGQPAPKQPPKVMDLHITLRSRAESTVDPNASAFASHGILTHLGMGFEYDPPVLSYGEIDVLIRYWSIIVVLVLINALLWRKPLRNWRRRRLGLCVKCGYDLRASFGRCPECGFQEGKERFKTDQTNVPSNT
ncbi:MAG TPA: hypothetical protein VFE47_12500 [Tepidisphaeraceae bacterium]|nr:hypothetical protein [Tepidisphaeraceae bacterium]